MIFPKLVFENLVQIDDKFRFYAGLTFTTDDETITSIELQPSATDAFIEIYNEDQEKWYLDWAYETDGEKVATLRVTTDIGTQDKTFTVNAVTEANDALLSDDNDLFPLDNQIMDYLPKGKSSFIYMHRKSQEIILAYLDEQRIWKNDNSPFTKQDLISVTDPIMKEQFNQWSIYQTMLLIMENQQMSIGDLYQEKKDEYTAMRDSARSRSSLKLNFNTNKPEELMVENIKTAIMVRR